MGRFATEIVIKVRDEASKEVALIFDQFGRNARALEAAADPSTQALERMDDAVKRQTVSLGHATRAIRSVAVPLAGALSPALGSVAGEIISVAAHTATLNTGLLAVGTVAGAVAVVVGSTLYQAYVKAAKAKKDFAEALRTGDVQKLNEELKKVGEEIEALAAIRDRFAKQGGPMMVTVLRDVAGRQKAVTGEGAVAASRIADIEAEKAWIEAMKKDAEAMEALQKEEIEREIKLVQARRELARSRITDLATLAAAEQDAAAKDIGRQTERALAAKAADATMLESRQTLARAYAEILEQQAEGEHRLGETILRLIAKTAEASRAAFAERSRMAEDATATQVAGIEQATAATLRGAQIQLEAMQKSLAALKAEPLFRGGQDAGMLGQAATMENQIKAQQAKITEIVRAGANERAKAEEEGLARIRQLRLQDAQQALQDLQRTIAAEKAARDQARADATGLLGQAIANLQQRGHKAATWRDVQTEARRLALEQKDILGSQGNIDLSKASAALGNIDLLGRVKQGEVNFSGLLSAATGATGLSAMQQQIEREFLLSGRRIPKGGLFAEKEGAEVGAARARAQQAVGALAEPLQAGAKGALDVVIQTLGPEGEKRFVVLGQAFAKALWEGFAKNPSAVQQAADAVSRDIARMLLERGEQSGF